VHALLGVRRLDAAFCFQRDRHFGNKRIVYAEPIDLESLDGSSKSGAGRSGKPSGGTPRIVLGTGYDAVAHGVLMHVLQAGQIRIRERDMCVNTGTIPFAPAGCLAGSIRGRKECAVWRVRGAAPGEEAMKW
jgi:hypothetical protein